MRKIALLGSTGSIGRQTLDVVRTHPERFEVVALTAHGSDELLLEQIEEFKPLLAVLVDEDAASRLKARYHGKTRILAGQEALLEAAILPEADVVVTAVVGFAGLRPTIAAIRAKKDIALANKETLVAAGEIVMREAREAGVAILPVDSEHSALFQCLQGEPAEAVSRLLLTASGGPFRGWSKDRLATVTVEDCLKHPTWAMGQKITIDSASLANKGLEVIEAKWLYGVDYDQIEVVVHPQSIVHSMIEYADGSVKAQLGLPDMRLPIQYALTYPERIANTFPKMNFYQLKDLSFHEPDMDTFAALRYAYDAGKTGGTMPCVFNAANEEAVFAFLKRKLRFLDIYELIHAAMQAHQVVAEPTLDDLFAADAWARKFVQDKIK